MRFTEKDKQGRLIYCAVIIIQKYFGAIVGICFDNFTKGNFDCAAGAAYTRGDVETELTIEKVPQTHGRISFLQGKCQGISKVVYKNLYQILPVQ